MRKTKIVATLGPATDSPEILKKLLQAGMDVARLNMSHATHDWIRRVVRDLRAAAAELNKPLAILLDTQGPAIRTGDLPAALDLQPGQKFTLTVRGERSEEEHSVDVNYEEFINDINVGDVVLLDNGEIHMKVLAKHSNKVECEVLTPGKLGSRRHINLPGVKVSLPALTAKDIADVRAGLEVGVDYIALSFVREARDIQQLRALTESATVRPLIIAKIEDQQAVANMDSIVATADGVMVARGDLGIECPYEDLPLIQRRIVKTCLRVGKPVIVATHMLESMIENPMPTRAEISDVANAVFEQADAIMLSGETTVGKYPVKCVEVFDKITRRIERSGAPGVPPRGDLATPRQKLVKSAVLLSEDLEAEAIVVFTIRGNMPRNAASFRPFHAPIYAICDDPRVAQSMSLVWGVMPLVMPFDHQRPEENIEDALDLLKKNGSVREGSHAVIISSMRAGEQIIDVVEMRVV
ncbi:MAG: pyruvate kinase [Verrucomicrobia bacterium]|nr:pyruvate kinase [Verrucomicrobiota bacterium]